MSNSNESHESSFTNSQKRSMKPKRAARKSKSPENSERRVKAKRKSKSPEKKKENSDPIGDCIDEGFLKYFSPGSVEPYVRPECSEPTRWMPFYMGDYNYDSDESWGYSKPMKDDDAAWCSFCKQMLDVAHLRSCIKANGIPLMPWESLGAETTDLCSPKA